MAWNQLYFALYLTYYACNFILSLTDFLMKCIFEKGSKLSTFHSLMRTSLMLAIRKAITAFKLLTSKTVMCKMLVLMEPFLTSWRAVIRRKMLLRMSSFFLWPMKIPKTSWTILLLIFYAIHFCCCYFAVGTKHFRSLPLIFLPEFELSIILPLILTGISHHVFVGKNRKLLLSWTHVHCIKLGLVLKKILYW